MIEKISNILRRYNFARQIYRVVKRIDFAYSIPQISPIHAKKSRFIDKRINLVIPSINKEHFFGGVSTALALFKALAGGNGKNIPARILLTDAIPGEDDLKEFPGYKMISSEEDSNEECQIVPIVHKYQRKVFTGPEDRFLSTSWWTAYCTIHMVDQQTKLFGDACNRMGYLIQDYEPGFYNWSTHYALAESTYRSNVLTFPIFNSTFLRDYFKNKGYSFEKEFVFEPRLHPMLKKYLVSKDKVEKDQRILIYGRPSVARNCFPLIVESMRIWASEQTDSKKWDVISVGETHKNIPLEKGTAIRSLGKLSLQDYARQLLRSAIGISLMVSPHPSYIPLEMAHFGLLTITNTYANKDLSSWHENILSLDCLTPDRIAEVLLSCVNQFSKDPHIGLKGQSLVLNYYSDSEMFPFIGELFENLFPPLQ